VDSGAVEARAVSADILVSVGRARAGMELRPRYDDEARLLVVESSLQREWPYGVDIDGNIVFDLDKDRVLANFDLNVSRRNWKRGLAQAWPVGSRVGVIQFSDEAIKHKSFNLPLALTYDEEHMILRIDFGLGSGDRAVSLSNECVALLSGQKLTGFVVRGF
jgi:hypothetical protein